MVSGVAPLLGCVGCGVATGPVQGVLKSVVLHVVGIELIVADH